MVKNQRKKARNKRAAVRTGAARASVSTGRVHRHPAADVSVLERAPYELGEGDLEVAARLVGACRSRCRPCQETLVDKVVDRHRPLLAALAGVPYGLALNEAAAHSSAVSATTRSWVPLARAAAGSGDGAAARAAVEEMDTVQAAELLEDALDHWALAGASAEELADLLAPLLTRTPPSGPGGENTDAVQDGGLRVFTVDDLALDDVDAYHLSPNYALFVGTLASGERATPMLTLTPETEDAGIEDLRVRAGWPGWGLDLSPAPDPRWEVRVRRADRALAGIVCIGSSGDEVAVELWRASEVVTMPADWWSLLEQTRHIVVAGPVQDAGDKALRAAAGAGELLAVTATVRFI
ncbi:hypothetical protein ACGFWE_42850 [Streptomyces sp. NPDC048523]|uniref:hypothetical protein n=1 Tax=Streptomyces sp. NPDC048523 TaxID=3365567 RepID=UPI00371BBDA0